MVATTGGLSTTSGSFNVTPSGQKVGTSSISTFPSGGGKKKQKQPIQGFSTQAPQSYESQLLQQSFSSPQARADAESSFRAASNQREKARRDKITSQTLGGQLSSTGGLASQPTAKEEVLQMSIGKPNTSFGNIKTRETYIEDETYRSIQGQVKGFQGMNESQLLQSGVVGMSTPQGSLFLFTPDVQKARSQAELSFASLPTSQRFSLLEGSAIVAGAKTGVAIGEFIVNVPLALGGTYDSKGNFKTVKADTFTNKLGLVRDIKALPSGGATTGFEVALGVGLITKGVTSTVSAVKAKGLGEALVGFSPIRAKPTLIVAEPTLNKPTILEVPRGNGKVDVFSISSGKSPASLRLDSTATNEASQVVVGKFQESSTGLSSLGRGTVYTRTTAFELTSSGKILAKPNFVVAQDFVGKGNSLGRNLFQGEIFSGRKLTKFGGVSKTLGTTEEGVTLSRGIVGRRERKIYFDKNAVTGFTNTLKINSPKGFQSIRFPEPRSTADPGFSILGRGRGGSRPSGVLSTSSGNQQTTSITSSIVSKATTLPSAPKPIGRPSYSTGSYAGLGLYERGEQQSSVRTLGSQRLTLDPRFSKTPVSQTGLSFTNLSYPTEKNTPRLVPISFGSSPTRSRTPSAQTQIFSTLQTFRQTQIFSTLQTFRQEEILRTPNVFSLRGSNRISPPTTTTGFPFKPYIPAGGFLSLGTSPGVGSLNIGKFSPRYTPSLTASAFNIRGVVPKRYRQGNVDPFGTRVIASPGRRKKRR